MATASKKKESLELEDLLPKLHDNHIYPDTVTEKGKVVALHVNCSPITMDDKKAYLEKVLEGKEVVITRNTKEQFLIIQKKK